MAGLAASFGSGAMTNSIAEIEFAKVLFVIGSNTTECHPIIALKIKEAVTKHNAKLIVADPRRIELCDFATIHLRHKPGTDVALINGLLNIIISEGLHDRNYINERTEGFDKMAGTVAKYTPEYVEKITGVPKQKLIEAARLYANSKPASIIYCMGITQHRTGTDNVFSLANLAMATGNIGVESGGLNPLRGQSNVQGACDMGALPNFFTAYQRVDDPVVREKFARAWNVSTLPDKLGLTISEMITAAYKGNLKALFIMGENPALSEANLNHTREALKSLEFLVVQDIFLTDTAQMADVVLPAACFAEKEGTFTNTERRVQLVRKAVEPPGEALPDWQIIAKLSNLLGYPMRYKNAEQIFKEMTTLTPSYAGITYKRLEKGGIQWPCPDRKHPGTKILHKEKFARGKGKFHSIEYLGPAETPDSEYPFYLTTGRILYHFHTSTMTGQVSGLNQVAGEPFVQINPEDAKRLGIKDSEMVKVSTRRGELLIKAKITDMVGEGVLFIPFHYRNAPANLLTSDALDSIAKIPGLKVCSARLTKQ